MKEPGRLGSEKRKGDTEMGCPKHQNLYVTGCSKQISLFLPEICQKCAEESKSNTLISPSKKTPAKTLYNPIKTSSNMVKTVSILGEGGD
jgi:hypothetical protein